VNKADKTKNRRTTRTFIRNVIVKGLGLFLILNFFFGFLWEIPFANLSLYNRIFPGRKRFPFGENLT